MPNKRRDSHGGVKKSEARVQSGKEQRSPDPTRPQASLFFSFHRYYRAMHHFAPFYKIKAFKRLVTTMAANHELCL